MQKLNLSKKILLKVPKVKFIKEERQFSVTSLLVFAFIFGCVGAFIIWHTFAATTTVAKVEAETMRLPLGASIIGDANASGSQTVKMTQTGGLNNSIILPANTTYLSVTARADQCSGSPNLSVTIDGILLLDSRPVNTSTYAKYGVSKSLASGSHTLKVTGTLLGPVNQTNCARTLYVDVTTFSVTVNTPVVTLTASPVNISSGQSSTLSWSATNATSCSATSPAGWTSSQSTSGSQIVTPNATTTYSMSCTGTGGNSTASTQVSIAAVKSASKPVFAIYYMWWSNAHWHDKLGSNYPYTRIPNPLPATLNSGSCGSKSLYSGNTLTDVSQTHGTQNFDYDQDKPGVIEKDVRLAASRGVTGFMVNWKGNGTTSQTTTNVPFNHRLQAMFDAVHKVNSEGIPFKIQLNYQASAVILSSTYIKNDLNYYIAHYGSDSALDHTYSKKPAVTWAGSWKYSNTMVSSISQAMRPRLYLIGDEKTTSWDANAAANFDGDSYYWSSQDPYVNPASFSQLKSLAANIRSTKNPDGSNKIWISPFSPGYNGQLLYGTSTCVPRNGTTTIHTLFDGNLQSNPDGWSLISWNEVAEGSYVVPLTRYGNTYVDALQNIIQTNK